MVIAAIWIIWIILGCWGVSRAIVWLPLRMAEDEDLLVAEIMAAHQAKDFMPHQVDARFLAGDFFSKMPPCNVQSFGLSVAAILIALCVIYAYGLGLAAAVWSLFGWGLLVLAGVDSRTKLLPDVLTLPLMWLGIVIQMFPETSTVGLQLSVVGVVAGYVPLWLLAQAYRLLCGRDGLGMGDLKLLAAMGAWSGPFVLPQVLLLAALLAIGVFVLERLLRRSNGGIHEERPFGPAIVAAYFIVMAFAYSVSP
jgi:prepilin signal peptidase PulO-like enzyme (type II secretory pathway)